MNKYWIWFSRINKIGAKTQYELLKKYKTPEKIWGLGKAELEETITKEQIKIITIQDANYPQKLLKIFDPPIVLYAKGNIDILNNTSIAIIGSRVCSDYGEQVAKQFAYNLSKHNINVISGLAKGIDTYAHQSTITASGKTIAVLGCGIDIVYPKENVRFV